MCADSSDPYLAKAIYYIEQKLRANGYDSILCCTGYDLDTKASSMNLLITKKVDGIILVGSNFIYDKEDDNKYILDAAGQDRKSTRLNSSHNRESRMPSSA